jgi:hypothetical protein
VASKLQLQTYGPATAQRPVVPGLLIPRGDSHSVMLDHNPTSRRQHNCPVRWPLTLTGL